MPSPQAWLNYHHLYYFWRVARCGTITRAAAELRLRQPTVSAQLSALEGQLGEKLFTRAGRSLRLTEAGQVALQYAEQIFGLGQEFMEVLRGRGTERTPEFRVGVANVVPKQLACRLLEPLQSLSRPFTLICEEDNLDDLLARLALHRLDLVLSDAPVGPEVPIRAYNHPLGECGVSFMAVPKIAGLLRGKFPRCLDGAPLLIPTPENSLRASLAQWFEQLVIAPRIIAEFDDSAMLKMFGQSGAGVFPCPSALEGDVREQYGAVLVGRTEAVRERFFAITTARKISHPAIAEVLQTGRRIIVSPPRRRRN